MDNAPKLEKLLEDALVSISSTTGLERLDKIRIGVLGKKGSLTAALRGMKDIAPKERPLFGKRVNEIRDAVTKAMDEKISALEEVAKKERLKQEHIDVTLPGTKHSIGGLHPLTQIYYETRDIFVSMGFEIMDGPEVEYDKYNFEMLNIPKDHPARDMQDTFYVTPDIVLRTHTSPVQIRTMLRKEPPIRVIAPGRVYRSDDVDSTHSPIFNQIEGLVVGKDISFANLKDTLNRFLKEFYGKDTKTKFRPGHFPFTEPSAEVDATCAKCGGSGCGVCKGTGMIEILGCGMVHPSVLAGCGIDPEVYTGFAFGMGLDRLATIKYGITDIRLLFENDIRFLSQFK
ncbi:MAG: phenylalanine--tRNA ligase subunit alpha [Clostridia bacterium]|jgi:phenylalanyl-tRNA synthetase alpha chain|nr:phenylalanine--tRNA ligase subunit alpha [Clostridia bacterium]MBT7121899.1 phenylalanine--tRNA ligase subunit alpha [Clostridia bacterium]